VRVFVALLSVSASLHVTVWPHGTGGAHRTWTLRCAPVRGTLPHRAGACAKLARIARPFAPVPTGVACSDIYGGPQVARVAGTFRGRGVRATFNRRDGCEIARWDAVRFLFPAF
jgi:Subtilisin inhibitor-like